MRKTKLILVLLLALLPFVGWAQQNYYGQHVSIKLATGDSIQYDLASGGAKNVGMFCPQIKGGKVVWSFQSTSPFYVDNPEVFSFDNVESIDFRSKEYDDREVRKALIEFYQALDGDHWIHNDNWCSDKPIWEWYGVNVNGWNVPFVTDLNLYQNNLTGEIPEGCITRMGPIHHLSIGVNNIKGSHPNEISKLYSLEWHMISGNHFSGPFPWKSISDIPPHLLIASFDDNHFEGSFPDEDVIKAFWDNKDKSLTWLTIRDNYFTGKVPDVIKNHPRFSCAWYYILPQRGKGLDLSDVNIPAPVFHKKYMDGTTVNSDEVYKQNKYTLIYKWGWWCSSSEGFNNRLTPVYNTYKDKGFEIIGIHANNGVEIDMQDYFEKHPIPWKNIDFDEWVSHVSELANSPEGDVLDFIENWLEAPTLMLVDQNGNVVFTTLMDEIGKKYDDGRQWDVFDFLEKEFGPVEYELYTSTDYSHDGEVVTLQEASEGQGIDLVFVGEGFTDKDIADGTFDQRMNEAYQQFFRYEPYSSLNYRFNVYAVKAVSPNAEFLGNAKHAIDLDNSKAFEYASKVPNLKPNRPMYVNVIYNNNSGGRSYCTMLEDNSYVCYAMDGVSNVLNHEAGGHGIGKLLDEYIESGNESLTLPEGTKTYMEDVWTLFGWGANVDWRSNPTEVKWAKFINDERYKDEQIGVFEGSYLYGYGAYRPTENSIMRETYLDSALGFNAPSREAIYKRVMQESEGDGWTYDYETFVAFDAAGHSQFVNALNAGQTRRRGAQMYDRQRHTAPPVFLKGTWRDVLNKNNK